MKSIFTAVLLPLASLGSVPLAAFAGWDDGYWHLDFKSGSSSTASPLRVGVDLGDSSGFSFQTLVDDNSDGVIHLPLVPVGGRLAIGGTDANGEVGCDLWDLTGRDLVGGTAIQKPLLIVAEDVEGESLGADYGDFTQPPFALTPGAPYTVTNGSIAGWAEPHFVNDFGVPGLEEFVQTGRLPAKLQRRRDRQHRDRDRHVCARAGKLATTTRRRDGDRRLSPQVEATGQRN